MSKRKFMPPNPDVFAKRLAQASFKELPKDALSPEREQIIAEYLAQKARMKATAKVSGDGARRIGPEQMAGMTARHQVGAYLREYGANALQVYLSVTDRLHRRQFEKRFPGFGALLRRMCSTKGES